MPIKFEMMKINQKDLKNYKKLTKKLLIGDMILMLAHISPIRGDTKLQKQVFLTWKTVFPKICINPGYVPWKYGAYSKTVGDITKILLEKQFLKLTSNKGKTVTYMILPKGEKYLQERLKNLRLDFRDLYERKKDWDDWSSSGTLKHVYRNYPSYTTHTMVPEQKW